jgi:hypothetical protein
MQAPFPFLRGRAGYSVTITPENFSNSWKIDLANLYQEAAAAKALR